MPRKAIAYIRWSTLEQGNADRSSEERQEASIRRAATVYGLGIVELLVDKGRSAFTGENLTRGHLGRLTGRLMTGALDPNDHVLLVEELDRLSRRSPAEMIAWIMPLLSAGLHVRVANTDQLISKTTIDNDFGGFVTMMSASFAAHEFSRKQSERGNASWAKHRKETAEDGKPLRRHRARGWLNWNSEARRYEVIEERAWLVREMFRLRIDGNGKTTIAVTFNKLAHSDGRYSPFSTSRTPPKAWTASAIARIVQDRGVLGFVQYTNAPRGCMTKTPVGEPVQVYPAIIDFDTWARANDARLENQLRYQGRGKRVANLLGRISRCGECDGAIQPLGSSRVRTNKDGSKSQHYFLYCQTAKMTKGRGCSNQRGWTYSKIETPLLDSVLELALDDQFFQASDDEGARLEGEVVRCRRNIADIEASMKRLVDLIADTGDDIAHAKYRRLKIKIAEARTTYATAQADLAKAKGCVSERDHVARVGDVRHRMNSEDEAEAYEARSLAKMSLHALIDRIVFQPNGLVLVILIKGLGMFVIRDGRASFLDLYREGRHGSSEEVKAYARRRAA